MSQRGPLMARWRSWLALIKPRIIELLLITTVPAMVLAQRGWPGGALVAATLLGGILTAGGANALNNVVDRDVDAKMDRTRRRPLPRADLGPVEALVAGLLLGATGVVWLWFTTTPLAALLALAAMAFYVVVYTLALKRTTPQNIVIGGAAGAAPALIGWAAVTGSISLEPWLLFAIVFFWTPPHFWALAIRFRDDYAAAGIPMLPVVAGVPAAAVQIVLYAVALLGVTLLLAPVAALGTVYLTVAIALGAGFVVAALRLVARPERALAVFRYSNLYLALLFGAVALDVLVAA
ncbi:MAG TPA: heme o synthase [Acidimicrobiia bacterium]|nr:heme o synthase [Acidimicrobiia bacterium]